MQPGSNNHQVLVGYNSPILGNKRGSKYSLRVEDKKEVCEVAIRNRTGKFGVFSFSFI